MVNGKSVLLNCRHTNKFRYPPPKNGEDVYCYRCSEWRMVMSGGDSASRAYEYRANCRNCRYGRHYGTSKLSMEVRVAGHRRRYPTHVVDLFDLNGSVYATYTPPTMLMDDASE